MSRYFEVSDFYKNGVLDITEQGVENLFKLSEVVMNTHYSYVSSSDKEELKSVGMLKAMELLKNGGFDPTRSTLKNYLYTGMRNEMKNYLYKNTKEVIVDDDIMIGINEDKAISIENMVNLVDITDSDIKKALGRLSDGKIDKIKSYLKSVGFEVDYDLEGVIDKEVEKEVALVIWQRIKR